MAKVLCITGMHRSGTSLVASWLNACGVVTDDGESYGPGVGNQFGHFEDADFARLQAIEIENAYKKSKGWIVTDASTPLAWSDRFGEQASRLIGLRNEKYACWSWKDPRSVILLDAWKQLIPGLKYLFLWRPCCDVAMSLLDRKKRANNRVYDITLRQAVKTWVAYNRRLLAFIQANQERCVMVPIHHVLEHDESVARAIVDRLGIDLSYKPISGLFKASAFQSRPPSWWLKRCARAEQADRIEQELMDRSYTKPI